MVRESVPATSTLAASLVVPIVLQGDLFGELFLGDCQTGPSQSLVAGLPAVSRTPGDLPPVVLSAGDLLGLSPLTNYALDLGGDAAADLARGLLREDGEASIFDAILPGNLELAMGRLSLRELTEGAKLPWVVANMTPRFPAERERLIRRGPVVIGVTGVFDDALASKLPRRARDEELVPAGPALDQALQRLRDAGAHVLVAMLHLADAGGASTALRLLSSLQGPLPHLVLLSGIEGGAVELIRLRGGVTWVVPVPRGVEHAALARVEVLETGEARVLETSVEEVHPEVNLPLDSMRLDVCSQLDLPLSEKPVPAPVSREEFIRFVLQFMRKETRAEIAVINGQAFGGDFPIERPLTRLELYRIMPFANGMQVAEIRGNALGPLTRLLDNPRVNILGLTRDRVAGRPIDPLRGYRVVTVDFLATGGDDLIPAGTLPFEPQADRGQLRDEVADFISEHGLELDADPSDPDFDIDEPTLLGARFEMVGTVKTVSVNNAGEYPAPQLTRGDFLGLAVIFEARLIADFVRHRLELMERTRYGIAKDGRLPARENDDVTRGELTYFGRLARLDSPWWVPDASASVSIETELTLPDPPPPDRPMMMVRDYRRLLLEAGVGPSWRILPNLNARSQLGVRRELLAPEADPAHGTRMALLSTVDVMNYAIDSGTFRPITMTVRVDHALDLTGENRDNILQSRASFDIPISMRLSVTAGLEVYVQHRHGERELPVGVGFDTNFGIRTTGDVASAWF